MKTYSAEALAEMESGSPIVTWALEIYADAGDLFWWGGYGTLRMQATGTGTSTAGTTADSAAVTADSAVVTADAAVSSVEMSNFIGLGDHGAIGAVGAVTGSGEDSLIANLSGVDPDVLGTVDLAAYKRASVVLWLLIFDSSGAHLLDAHVYKRGRLDQAPYKLGEDGTATISAVIEGAARGSNRSNGRVRSDADQRLIKSTDGGMKAVSYAGKKTLYWGGTIPEVTGKAVT